MAVKTNAQLTTAANVIKNETDAGENTATRVGDMIKDIIDSRDTLAEDRDVAADGHAFSIKNISNAIIQSGEATDYAGVYIGISSVVLDAYNDTTGDETVLQITPTLATINFGTGAKNIATVNYKVYTAVLNATGTGDPTPTVLESTYTGTVVWTRSALGVYLGTLSGVFTVNKTVVFINNVSADCQYLTIALSANQVRITQKDLSGSNFDELFGNCVEIRTYP